MWNYHWNRLGRWLRLWLWFICLSRNNLLISNALSAFDSLVIRCQLSHLHASIKLIVYLIRRRPVYTLQSDLLGFKLRLHRFSDSLCVIQPSLGLRFCNLSLLGSKLKLCIHALHFYHYDFYSQALAKIERGHRVDVEDVRAMRHDGLIEPRRLRGYFEKIKPELYRYPAIDAKAFKNALDKFIADNA